MGFCYDGFGWGGWMPWGGTWGGLALSLVFFAGALAVLVSGSVWFARQLRHTALASQVTVDPVEIAKRRLAAGKITVADYEEIRDRLLL